MKYLKYIAYSLIVIIPSIITILIYNDKITQNSPIYYKQGVDFYNKGDYQNAYYNFGQINRISPLYSIAVYKQAKSAQKAGDFKTAALKYKLFIQRNPNSLFTQTAAYNLAKCYYYLKEYNLSKEYFLLAKSKDKDEVSAADYYLGEIEKQTNKEEAAKYFLKYLSAKNDLDRNYEIAAAQELTTLGKELNNNEKLIVGKTYYRNKKYNKALEFFSKLPLDECWDYLVLSNHYAGNKVIAKKLIENDISTYSNKIQQENLHKIYDVYTSYMSGSKLKNWTQMLKLIRSNSLAGEDYALYKLAETTTPDKALAYYNDIQQKFPGSLYAPEALCKIFKSYYKSRNYKSAEATAIKHLKTFKNINSTAQMLFWLSKTEINLNKISEANSVLSKLAANYPDDYYGLRAEYILNKKNDFWQTNPKDKVPNNNEEISFPISLSHLDIKDLKLINTLFEMGDYEIWLDADFENKIAESWFELRKDKKSKSIVLARDAIQKMDTKPSFYSAAYKLAYPLHWNTEINIAAEKLNLDAFLINQRRKLF